MNGKYNRDILLKLEEYKVIYLYTSPKMPLWEKENSIDVIAISDEFDICEKAARFELELSTLIISDKATIRVEAIHPYFFKNNPDYSVFLTP
jgi:hypothetical protein